METYWFWVTFNKWVKVKWHYHLLVWNYQTEGLQIWYRGRGYELIEMVN